MLGPSGLQAYMLQMVASGSGRLIAVMRRNCLWRTAHLVVCAFKIRHNFYFEGFQFNYHLEFKSASSMQTTRECAAHEVAFLCNTHLSQQPVTNWSGNTHLTDQSPGLCDQGPKKNEIYKCFWTKPGKLFVSNFLCKSNRHLASINVTYNIQKSLKWIFLFPKMQN